MNRSYLQNLSLPRIGSFFMYENHRTVTFFAAYPQSYPPRKAAVRTFIWSMLFASLACLIAWYPQTAFCAVLFPSRKVLYLAVFICVLSGGASFPCSPRAALCIYTSIRSRILYFHWAICPPCYPQRGDLIFLLSDWREHFSAEYPARIIHAFFLFSIFENKLHSISKNWIVALPDIPWLAVVALLGAILFWYAASCSGASRLSCCVKAWIYS